MTNLTPHNKIIEEFEKLVTVDGYKVALSIEDTTQFIREVLEQRDKEWNQDAEAMVKRLMEITVKGIEEMTNNVSLSIEEKINSL